MTEAALQRKVIAWCRANGYLALKFVAPSRAGVPDLLILGNGRTLFYELKHPSGAGRLTPLQAATHEQMRKYGADIHVGHDFDEITATIRARLG